MWNGWRRHGHPVSRSPLGRGGRYITAQAQAASLEYIRNFEGEVLSTQDTGNVAETKREEAPAGSSGSRRSAGRSAPNAARAHRRRFPRAPDDLRVDLLDRHPCPDALRPLHRDQDARDPARPRCRWTRRCASRPCTPRRCSAGSPYGGDALDLRRVHRNDLLDLHYPAPPIYPTVQCGINLTVQLFVVCGLLWIFITRKQSKAETPGSNTVKNAMEAAWGCSSARGSRSSSQPATRR